MPPKEEKSKQESTQREKQTGAAAPSKKKGKPVVPVDSLLSQVSVAQASADLNCPVLKVQELKEAPFNLRTLMPDYDPANPPIITLVTIAKKKKKKTKKKSKSKTKKGKSTTKKSSMNKKNEDDDEDDDLSDRYLVPEIPAAHYQPPPKRRLPNQAVVPQAVLVKGPAGSAINVPVNNREKDGKATPTALPPEAPIEGVLILGENNRPVFLPTTAKDGITDENGEKVPITSIKSLKGRLIRGPKGQATFVADDGPKVDANGVLEQQPVLAAKGGDDGPVTGVLEMGPDGMPEFRRVRLGEAVPKGADAAGGALVRDEKTGVVEFVRTVPGTKSEVQPYAKAGDVQGVMIADAKGPVDFVASPGEAKEVPADSVVGHVVKGPNGMPVFVSAKESGVNAPEMEPGTSKKMLEKELKAADVAVEDIVANIKAERVSSLMGPAPAVAGVSPPPVVDTSSPSLDPPRPSPSANAQQANRPKSGIQECYSKDEEYMRYLSDRSVSVMPYASKYEPFNALPKEPKPKDPEEDERSRNFS